MRFIPLLSMAFVGIHLCGCIYTVDTRVKESGKAIEQADISKVELNKTTRAELETLFGPPTGTQKESDGSETLKYIALRRTTVAKKVPLIYADQKQFSNSTAVCFEVRGGVVTRTWTQDD